MTSRSSVIKVSDIDELDDSRTEDDSASTEGVQLRKTITLLNAITIIVGSVIGSGIFLSPGGVLRNVRSLGASLIIWVFSGLLSFFGVYCYAELGTMIPKSGGDYSYYLEAYGGFVAFLRLWVEVIVVRPASIAIISMVFASYGLNPFFPTCDQPRSAVKLLALLCILILGLINSLSVRVAALVQDIFTYAKLFALALIIVTGIVQLGRGFTDSFEDPFEGTTTDLGRFAVAFYIGLFAYSGWNYLSNMTEEMVNVPRDMPIAASVSCALITVFYTLANVAYVTLIPVSEMYETEAVAVVFARRIYGPVWWIMPIFVSCSTFGGVNGTIMTTARMYYVASKEGHMPQVLSFLNLDRRTPIPAVIFTCIVSIAYLMVDDVYALINYTGFVMWLAIAGSVFIVILFRFTRRNAPRPVRAPIVFAVVFILVVLLLCIFSFVGSPRETLMGIVVIATGVPVYVIGVAWKKKPKALTRAFNRFSVGSQKLLRLVPPG